MGNVQTVKYVRKPIFVEAVQVTAENFLDVVNWCQGLVGVQGSESGTEQRPADGVELDPSKHYIRIRVHQPKSKWQTRAVVGDWILYTDKGYKIYNDRAFRDNFEMAEPKDGGPLPPELSPEEEAKTY